jgi:hypothetical protein
MKPIAVLAVVAMLTLAASVTALAAPNTGTTALLGPAVSGSQVDVDVSVSGGYPIVPGAYAIQNECHFDGKASGNADSYQRDDILFWFNVGGIAHATMPVYFHDIPAGSACKVFLIKNNTAVKGSTTIYMVGP